MLILLGFQHFAHGYYEILNDGEIAGEVSDDFEIMCKAYCLEYEDLWLAKMAKIYADKKIPYGVLNVKCGTFKNEFIKIA